jgi:hypothetical protein
MRWSWISIIFLFFLPACARDSTSVTPFPEPPPTVDAFVAVPSAAPSATPLPAWQVLSESDNIALAPQIVDPVSGAMIRVLAVAKPNFPLELPENLECIDCDHAWRWEYSNSAISIRRPGSATRVAVAAVYVEVVAPADGVADPFADVSLDAWQPLRSLFTDHELDGDALPVWAAMSSRLTDRVLTLGCRPGSGDAPTSDGWYTAGVDSAGMLSSDVRRGWLVCASPDVELTALRFAWLPADIGSRENPHDYIRVWEPARVLAAGEFQEYVYPFYDSAWNLAISVPSRIAFGDVRVVDDKSGRRLFFSMSAEPLDESVEYARAGELGSAMRVLVSVGHPSAGYYLDGIGPAGCIGAGSAPNFHCTFGISLPPDATEVWVKVYALETPGMVVAWRLDVQSEQHYCGDDACVPVADLPSDVREAFYNVSGVARMLDIRVPLLCPGDAYDGFAVTTADYVRGVAYFYESPVRPPRVFLDGQGGAVLMVTARDAADNLSRVDVVHRGGTRVLRPDLFAYSLYDNGDVLFYYAVAAGADDTGVAYAMRLDERYDLAETYLLAENIPAVWRLKCEP